MRVCKWITFRRLRCKCRVVAVGRWVVGWLGCKRDTAICRLSVRTRNTAFLSFHPFFGSLRPAVIHTVERYALCSLLYSLPSSFPPALPRSLPPSIHPTLPPSLYRHSVQHHPRTRVVVRVLHGVRQYHQSRVEAADAAQVRVSRASECVYSCC